MLVKDRVMPTEYCFTALIGCLGRVGYTKKAFSLYNKVSRVTKRLEYLYKMFHALIQQGQSNHIPC